MNRCLVRISPRVLCLLTIGCGHPQPIHVLGPDPSYGPRIGPLAAQPCPTSDPDHPSYCPVSPTEPLTKPLRAPASHYLLLIAAADPLTVATLRDRLREADLALRGRDLVAEVAKRATGVEGERWAAVAVAL
jgi:hypothetical protein